MGKGEESLDEDRRKVWEEEEVMIGELGEGHEGGKVMGQKGGGRGRAKKMQRN